MKIIQLFAVPAALLSLSTHAIPARAQSLDVIYNFSSAVYSQYPADSGVWGFTNVDGAHPGGRPVLSGNTLYGTTDVGGAGSGTLFSVNTDGAGYKVLHTFADSAGSAPYAGLILAGNTLYGTTTGGGGIVFSINTDGTGFTVLHTGGASPMAEVTLDGSTLYGTTQNDVFSVNTNGADFTEIHPFSQAYFNSPLNLETNWDGSDSWGSVVVKSNVLYGTASYAGPFGCGTIFAVNSDGSGFTVLKAFAGGPDGATPLGGLILAGNVLYGTTSLGGVLGQGTVFAIHTDGSGYAVLHDFAGSPDGANPRENLTFACGMLAGTTLNGGSGSGTIFALSTNGSGYSVLHAFDSDTEGSNPDGGLTMSGHSAYGTASYGGTNGSGTVFRLNLPVPAISGFSIQGSSLAITATHGIAGANFIVLASANYALPLCQWTEIASGSFNTNGDSTILATNSVDPSARQSFYTLRMR